MGFTNGMESLRDIGGPSWSHMLEAASKYSHNSPEGVPHHLYHYHLLLIWIPNNYTWLSMRSTMLWTMNGMFEGVGNGLSWYGFVMLVELTCLLPTTRPIYPWPQKLPSPPKHLIISRTQSVPIIDVSIILHVRQIVPGWLNKKWFSLYVMVIP